MTFSPYVGYGQGLISLGDQQTINDKAGGYILGLRSGFELSREFSIALDYSRSGPIDFTLPESYIKTISNQKLMFNSFSSGVGINYDFGSISMWYGYYPYHLLNEYTRDIKFKGSLTRIGLGYKLREGFIAQIFYDTSNLAGDSLSSVGKSLICYYSSTNSCSETGSMQMTYFAISSVF
jgi:hypothetical protein